MNNISKYWQKLVPSMQLDMDGKRKFNGRKEMISMKAILRLSILQLLVQYTRSSKSPHRNQMAITHHQTLLEYRHHTLYLVVIPFFLPSYCWPHATSVPGALRSVLSLSQTQNHHGLEAWACPCQVVDCKSLPWLWAGNRVPTRKVRRVINNANSLQDITHRFMSSLETSRKVSSQFKPYILDSVQLLST